MSARPSRTTTALIAGGVAAAGGALAVTGALLASAQINGPWRPKMFYTFTPFELQVPAEDIRYPSEDGVRLAAWWLPQPGATHTVICSHGFRGSRADLLGIGTGLWRAGANVLLHDFRGSGASTDGPRSLAHYEQADLRAAIGWVQQHAPGTRIDLVGYSMGAAVSLLVAARDERVDAVVADSSFADMAGVIRAAAAGYHVPGGVVPLVDLATRWRYGYSFAQVRPVDVIGQVARRIPVLLFHSTADTVVPVEHGQRLAEAAGPSARLVLTPGADHCGSYFADRPGYIATVAEFLRIR
ncbi:alpha/beta hydrolase [Brachybacterium sp. EF45031]|uniref:alpha/beta hydrolase n=1 Tax=Brachybacterium sillae TaxID=2810536 RepID=UPI00217DB847|nr:alpha/beta hydrolase [Brachybacterium sillae]MCS6711512.1 alpha/beta hydrolase [Brachybacterium sillae]